MNTIASRSAEGAEGSNPSPAAKKQSRSKRNGFSYWQGRIRLAANAVSVPAPRPARKPRGCGAGGSASSAPGSAAPPPAAKQEQSAQLGRLFFAWSIDLCGFSSKIDK